MKCESPAPSSVIPPRTPFLLLAASCSGEAQSWAVLGGSTAFHPFELGQRIRQVGPGHAGGDLQRHSCHEEGHRAAGNGIGTVQRASDYLRLRYEGTVYTPRSIVVVNPKVQLPLRCPTRLAVWTLYFSMEFI